MMAAYRRWCVFGRGGRSAGPMAAWSARAARWHLHTAAPRHRGGAAAGVAARDEQQTPAGQQPGGAPPACGGAGGDAAAAAAATPAAGGAAPLVAAPLNAGSLLVGLERARRHEQQYGGREAEGSGPNAAVLLHALQGGGASDQRPHQHAGTRPPPGQQQHEGAGDGSELAAPGGGELAAAAPGGADAQWLRVVAVCAGAALLMYSTRACISTCIVPMAEVFDWDKKACGAVLSAFFAGYSITQVWGGQLSDRYGGSAVLACGVAGWSLCAALTPWAAAHSAGALLAARAGLGLAQGVAFPAIHALLASGVPPSRRSASIGAIMALAHVGTAAAFGLSPALIQAGGWQLSFYVFAAAAALWAVPWARVHRDLTAARARAAGGGGGPGAADCGAPQQQHAGTPPARRGAPPPAGAGVGLWPLLRRREVWAIAITQYAGAFGFYGLMAWLPSFFLEHCGLQLSEVGGYTLAPYLLQAAVGAASGVAADHLIYKRGWRIRSVRVAFQVAAMLGPAAALTLATSPYGAHSAGAALALITLGMGLSALTSSGVSASHLDVAPRHAGLVFGCGNTAGTLAGLVAVPATGWVLHHTGSWALAFGLAAAHNVLGAAVWAAWAGGERLPEDGPAEDAAPAPGGGAAEGGGGGGGGGRPPQQGLSKKAA
ncbi:MAG: major facilitator superfamily domain-containing protein [Monoraphidium minutum]|nr:MAG: major facilitator superfamily domain-containing protein [Monoraphidium minutum]